jgi:hypothetical protein
MHVSRITFILTALAAIITALAADEGNLSRLEKLGLSIEDLDQAVTSKEPTPTIRASSLAFPQRHPSTYCASRRLQNDKSEARPTV